MDLALATLILTTWIVSTAASEPFSCRNLAGTSCTCSQQMMQKRFEIACPLVGTNTVDINYVPGKKLEVTCKNVLEETDAAAYLNFSEKYVEVTQSLDLLSIPEGFRGAAVEEIIITDCIVSNSTLSDFGFVGVKGVAVSGNGSFTSGELTKHFFAGVAADLETLSINEVGLMEINSAIFEGMTSLTSLHIYMNDLEEIGTEFSGLKRLKKLDLSRNKIKRINANAFRGMDNLEVLHLFDNDITQLPADIFNGLTNLVSLELSLNKLRGLPESLLEQLPNLQRFSIMKNQLETLPHVLFKNNKKLISVRISINPNLTTLPDAFLSELPELINVQLEYCSLNNLPSDLFKNTPNLQTLQLFKNNITEIPTDLFSSTKNLQELSLSFNAISSVSNAPFKSLTALRILKLNNNLLSRIDSLETLTNLRDLDLSNNSLEIIDLRFLRNLEQVNLSHNKIAFNDSELGFFSPFNGDENLQEINLRGNAISTVLVDFTLVNLKIVDLSDNEIKSLSYTDLQSPSGQRIHLNLKRNQITIIDMKGADIVANTPMNTLNSTVDLDGNPLVCDCNAYDLLRFFKRLMGSRIEKRITLNVDNLNCATPAIFGGKKVKSLALDDVRCKVDNCTSGCECFNKPHGDTFVMDCGGRGMKQVPFLEVPKGGYSRCEVYLQGNQLKEGPSLIDGYGMVKVLNLSNNLISDVKWIPDNAEIINLDNNNITHLSYNVLSKLNLTTLHNNPWVCDCAARNLSNFVNRNNLQYKENITCKNSNRLLSSMLEKELCPTSEILYASLGIIAALIITIPAVVFALYYKYNNEIKIWLFAHNLCLWFVTEEDLDKDKTYDAFISYSHVDEEFVHSELLQKLESGDNPYKICIHIRNFIPGEFIATQVMESVMASRRTIVVLSPDFLVSVWGKMEFRLAHTQAITDGVTRVIVILMGDVEDDPNMDEELRAYLKTNTYIKWGDPWFWDRLRYALPHRKIAGPSKKIDKLQNIVIKIDEMDLINGNSTPNCATSTPPAHPLLCKSHPLEFKPAGGERNTPPAEAGT